MKKVLIEISDRNYKECIMRTEWDTLSLGVNLIEAVQNGTLIIEGEKKNEWSGHYQNQKSN